MITVTFEKNHKERILNLILSGHAGYDEAGKDIVCSAASILAYTLAQEITDMCDAQMLSKKPVILLEKGLTEIFCVPKRRYYQKIAETFEFALTGYTLLSINYPDHIKLFGEAAEQL